MQQNAIKRVDRQSQENGTAAITAMLECGVRKSNYINTLCRQNAASVAAGGSLHVICTIL